MARTAEDLQAKIDALTDAIGSGEKQVAMGGQQITYRSISEMQTALGLLQQQLRELAVTDGTATKRSRQTYLYQSGRGY